MDTVACIVSSSGHAAPSYGVTVTLDRDTPVAGVSASAHVAGRPFCTIVAINAPLITGYPMADADTSCAPASCCPFMDAVAAADGTCPTDVATLADRRCAKATLFFSASAKGSLNLPALQGIQT
jgi:molybdopterin-guanine dinucleotide biosynthesis protein A